jgi:hypothetical protein
MAGITISSAPGDQWTDSLGNSGTAVLTHGHVGCAAVDAHGYCTGGAWPQIPGARWIWKSQLVSFGEAVHGIPAVSFWKGFYLPFPSIGVVVIHITADNAYELYINGELVGADGAMDVQTEEQPPYAWSTVDMYNPVGVPLSVGLNGLEVRVVSYATLFTQGRLGPAQNPAGLIYSASIYWLDPGEERPWPPEPEGLRWTPITRRSESDQ